MDISTDRAECQAHAPGRSPASLPAFPESRADAALVEEIREGGVDAALDLWQRHSGAARVAAAAHIEEPGAMDLVVNRAFARILDDIAGDRDPLGPFRQYFYRAVVEECGSTEPAVLGSSNVLRAFRRLPVREQTVLWYAVVEDLPVDEVCELVDEGADVVTAVMQQAASTLRTEWFAEMVCDPAVADACAWLVERTDARTAQTLDSLSAGRYDAHLARCEACTAFVAALESFPLLLRQAATPLFAGAVPAGRTLVPEGL